MFGFAVVYIPVFSLLLIAVLLTITFQEEGGDAQGGDDGKAERSSISHVILNMIVPPHSSLLFLSHP